MGKKTLGITMGDPAGIGADITVKALQSRNIYDLCRPVVIGDLYAIGTRPPSCSPIFI